MKVYLFEVYSRDEIQKSEANFLVYCICEYSNIITGDNLLLQLLPGHSGVRVGQLRAGKVHRTRETLARLAVQLDVARALLHRLRAPLRGHHCHHSHLAIMHFFEIR